MTDKITMDRKYTTRSGEPVELITVNGREPFPCYRVHRQRTK
jgi:hypothetical protein